MKADGYIRHGYPKDADPGKATKEMYISPSAGNNVRYAAGAADGMYVVQVKGKLLVFPESKGLKVAE